MYIMLVLSICLFFFSVCTTGYTIGTDSVQSNLNNVEQYQFDWVYFQVPTWKYTHQWDHPMEPYQDLMMESQGNRENSSKIMVKESDDTVLLQVYYECLCPGCREFHTGPLDDTMKKIGSYIDLKTYPYGNAMNVDGKTECQHGEEECYGNELHACAIDILNNATLSEFYNSCMMLGQWGGEGSTDMDADKCGESMTVDSKRIIECAKSQKGEDLLQYYGKETAKAVCRKGVPWILINGKYYDQEENLTKKICEALTNQPPECNQ